MNNTTVDASGIPPWQPINNSLYVISVLVSGLTVGANAVILACFFMKRNKKINSFSRMILSMTISDLLVGLVWGIYLGSNRNKGRMIGLVCNASLYLTTSLQCVSLYHVLGICLLRNKVLRSKAVSGLEDQQKRWAIVIIVISWILPMVVLAIPGIIWAKFSVDEIICGVDVVHGDNMKIVAFFVSSFYLTSQSLTDVIYGITIIHLWLELRKYRLTIEPTVVMNVATEEVTLANTNANRTDLAKMRMLKHQSDITSTIGYLLILFNFLTLPKTVGSFFVGRFESVTPSIIIIPNSLFILNSGFNPIVYATRTPWIKESLRRIAVELTRCFRIQR